MIPNIFVVQLRRFEFDFYTMRNVKIHDRLEFPFNMDTSNYLLGSTEGETEQFSEYELFSVIVHVGTAHSGHYYAFIKDFTDKQWYEFNDHK